MTTANAAIFEKAEKDREILRRLVGLALSQFPMTVEGSPDINRWATVGPALVARAARLVNAIIALPMDHAAESGVLVRALYEHVVTFAWIGIDPDKHVGAWRRGTLEEMVKAANDARDFGFELLDATTRDQYKTEIDGLMPYPNIQERATQADKFWIPKGALTDRSSFRGLYPPVYRQFSAVVHAVGFSAQWLLERGPPPATGMTTIARTDSPLAMSAFSGAKIMLLSCLHLSSILLHFPSQDALLAVDTENGGDSNE